MATLWFKQAEDSKPDYTGEKLEANKSKAQAIKKSKRRIVTKKAAKGGEDSEPNEGLVKLSAKIAAFRENFKAERQRRRTSLALYKGEDGRRLLVAQIYSLTGRWNYPLNNYKPLAVDPLKKAQYDIFNKLWLKYDINGCGKMTYADFEKLKQDVGFRWNDCPSVGEVDPGSNKVIRFEDMARWWFSKEADLTTRSKRSFSEMTQVMHDAKEKASAKLKERYHKRQRRSEKFRQDRVERRKKIGKSKKRNFAIEISTAGGPAKKRRLEYDVTNYKPLEVDETSLKQVDLFWMSYDKEGTGKISQEDFVKLCKEMGTEPDEAFKGKDNIVFEDFVQWWFDMKGPKEEAAAKAPTAKETKEMTWKSKLAGKLLSNEEVKEIRQKFAIKFAAKSREVKDLVKNSPMPKRSGRKSASVEIFSAKNEKITYDITNYNPGFVPRGLEYQEGHLDRIWKDFEKEGTGKLSKEQFGKFVESLGSKMSDDKALTSLNLQDKDGFITWERFNTWWFSKEKGVVPIAPPAPQAAKKEKIEAIRKGCKATAEKLKEKYNLKSDAEFKKRKCEYFACKETERAKFREKRANSPKKEKKNQFNVDIFSKKSGEIQHLSFVA